MTSKMKAEDILKRGSVDVHAKVGGIRQLHTLTVSMEETAWGTVPFLVSKHKIPAFELLRLAEELQLPIKCHGVTAFPKGKSSQDFVQKDVEEKAEAKEEREPEAKQAADPKEAKKQKKKTLAHGAIVNDESEQGETKEEKKEDPEESTASKEEAEPENKTNAESASSAPVAAPAEPQEQIIEVESTVPDVPKDANQEKTGESQKQKKRFFSDSVLSEGLIIR